MFTTDDAPVTPSSKSPLPVPSSLQPHNGIPLKDRTLRWRCLSSDSVWQRRVTFSVPVRVLDDVDMVMKSLLREDAAVG